MPEPVFYTPSASSSRSSIFTHTLASQSDEMLDRSDYEGYDSPPPVDEKVADMRNERRYRILLDHEFHPSRTPIFIPLPINWLLIDLSSYIAPLVPVSRNTL